MKKYFLLLVLVLFVAGCVNVTVNVAPENEGAESVEINDRVFEIADSVDMEELTVCDKNEENCEPFAEYAERVKKSQIVPPNSVRSNVQSDTWENIAIYFITENDNKNLQDCSKVDVVHRTISKDKDYIEELVRHVVKGPTDEELESGFQEHWISDESFLNSVKFENNVVYIDWKDIREMVPNASTSCGSQSFVAPFYNTLMEVQMVSDVVHTIEGSEDIFNEWMQI